jgi:chemotaxis protein methyltransferase CheR
MKPEDFDLFSGIVRQRSGLVLTSDKSYLLESRLPPVARKHGLKTIEELAQAVRDRRGETMMHDITEAMTTNESFFFRDQKPFDRFRQLLLPRFLQARAAKKQIRVWSAAASSGQEAYSLSIICAEEAARLQGWKIDILGTDLSQEMIERAKTGIYSQFEVQRGLPIALLVKYFQQTGDKWQIKDELRRTVQFRTGNLLQDLGSIGSFDVIFCRNVLIYFDTATKAQVFNQLAAMLAPDGVLILGGAETVLGITNKFKLMENESGLYVRADASTAAKEPPASAAVPHAVPFRSASV